MSHFTNIKTHFQNLFYLEKALTKLNFKYEKKENSSTINSFSNSYNVNLIIPQPNNYDLEFSWNGQEYELRLDRDFWSQTCSVNSFIDKIAQKYAGEVIIGESQKIGFQPVQFAQNTDGSNTIVLQRYTRK